MARKIAKLLQCHPQRNPEFTQHPSLPHEAQDIGVVIRHRLTLAPSRGNCDGFSVRPATLKARKDRSEEQQDRGTTRWRPLDFCPRPCFFSAKLLRGNFLPTLRIADIRPRTEVRVLFVGMKPISKNTICCV